MAVLDDGVLGRPELTIAFDVATRSICAAVLRPPGTKAVDAAVLLAQMVTPMPMHPGWDEALAMRRSVIPYERLVSLDERLEEAAARPVIMPETVVVDQGKVFVSASFLGACGSLGVSVQPVPPANGPAKGHVERNFGGINAGFCQYVAGYTGSDTTERGSTVEDEARWSLPQLQEFFDEWLITGWHHRKHSSLRHPLMPKLALSPNEMWAALVGVAGHVPVPLAADDYVELLPVKWLAINDYGIRFDYRTYDDKALNDQRGRRSTIAAQKGRWEVHHNPYDPNRIWVRLPDGFVEVPWIHTTQVSMPFTDFTWQHIRKTVRRRTGDRDAHELELAQALDDLLRRAHGGKATRRERSVAARANAAASMAAGPPAPAARLDVLSAPSVSFGLNGIYAPERAFDDDLPDQDDTDFLSALESDTDGEDDQVPPPRRSRRSSILNDAHQESDLWL
jgi:hypothetical protein